MHIEKRIICMKFYVWRRYYDIDTFYHGDSVNKRNTSTSTNAVMIDNRIAKQKLNRSIHTCRFIIIIMQSLGLNLSIIMAMKSRSCFDSFGIKNISFVYSIIICCLYHSTTYINWIQLIWYILVNIKVENDKNFNDFYLE